MGKHVCPICGFNGLEEDPGPTPDRSGSHEICPTCGWQFGCNNSRSAVSYRRQWVEGGDCWRVSWDQPKDWDLAHQLSNVGLTVPDVLQTAEAD